MFRFATFVTYGDGDGDEIRSASKISDGDGDEIRSASKISDGDGDEIRIAQQNQNRPAKSESPTIASNRVAYVSL